jgi:hypothetical protein
MRYNTKDYRNQIYSSIPKEELASQPSKPPLRKNIINKYKSMTKLEENQGSFKHTAQFKVAKHKSHSNNILQKVTNVI